MAELEASVLRALDQDGEIGDTADLAAKLGVDHMSLVGVMKSLESAEMVVSQAMDHFRFLLTDEAEGYRTSASPEVQVFNAIPQDGIDLKDLQEGLDKVVSAAGFKQAMQLKWIKCDKSTGSTTVLRLAEFVEDRVQALLQSVADGEDLPKADIDLLKKRRLIRPQSWKTYKLVKGPKFALEKRKPATELTHEMLKTGAWKDLEFKPYNFDALGQLPLGGHLHPLMKVRTQFRKIFTQMGFEEMPSNQYVESSFWNFDALFQPQQHPARDAHDTFFLTNPATSSNFPPDYMERVKTTHESGGYGSRGYEYHWKLAEAEKNVLRTHTTAVSSRMLYKIGQEGFRPVKYFSIDRVYRNEAIDRTHLAEFHQIEGLVCDKGLSLGDLIGTLHQFFTRLGLKQIRFKPAYNPYTEPSMEIFSYSEQLGKWIEVGNSGMFRPEMLRPMGLPEDVSVIAWGLSLERPTMILYGIDNIRDLFGHGVSLETVKKNPICRLGL